MKGLIICALFAAGAGYVIYVGNTPEAEAERARVEAEWCKPVHVVTAPDGTELWRIHSNCAGNGYDVFFSSKGTQTTERHGKISEPAAVPNEDDAL